MKLTGDWGLARQLVIGADARIKEVISGGLRRETQALRKEIVQGLTKQAPGGTAMEALSPWTLATRKLRNIDRTKALIVHADLRNAISTMVRGDTAFVGVPRKARSKNGRALVDIAKLNEFGSKPIIIPITMKMRRFLAVLGRVSGTPSPTAPSPGFLIVQIPARPFLRPAFRVSVKGAKERFLRAAASVIHPGVRNGTAKARKRRSRKGQKRRRRPRPPEG